MFPIKKIWLKNSMWIILSLYCGVLLLIYLFMFKITIKFNMDIHTFEETMSTIFNYIMSKSLD